MNLLNQMITTTLDLKPQFKIKFINSVIAQYRNTRVRAERVWGLTVTSKLPEVLVLAALRRRIGIRHRHGDSNSWFTISIFFTWSTYRNRRIERQIAQRERERERENGVLIEKEESRKGNYWVWYTVLTGRRRTVERSQTASTNQTDRTGLAKLIEEGYWRCREVGMKLPLYPLPYA